MYISLLELVRSIHIVFAVCESERIVDKIAMKYYREFENVYRAEHWDDASQSSMCTFQHTLTDFPCEDKIYCVLLSFIWMLEWEYVRWMCERATS